MKPEDLGIAPFTPEPGPRRAAPSKPAAAVSPLVAQAEDVKAKIHNLRSVADEVARRYEGLQSAYERSQAALSRAAAELFHVKEALSEARRHRTVLFVVGIALAALALVLAHG